MFFMEYLGEVPSGAVAGSRVGSSEVVGDRSAAVAEKMHVAKIPAGPGAPGRAITFFATSDRRLPTTTRMSAVDDDDDVATTVQAPLAASGLTLPPRRRRSRPTPTTAPQPVRFAVGTNVMARAAVAPRPRPPSPSLVAAATPTLALFPAQPVRLRQPLPLPLLPPKRLRSQPDAQARISAPLAWHWTVLAALVSLVLGFAVAFSLVSLLA
jgi:hypothetical protein